MPAACGRRPLRQLLPRGAKLRNTEFVYGVCVFCGPDTKLALNQKKPPTKFSRMDTRLNLAVLGIFIWQQV